MVIATVTHYKAEEQYQNAYRHVQALLNVQPNNPTAVFIAGEMSMYNEDFTLALECFEKASKMDNEQMKKLVSIFAFDF